MSQLAAPTRAPRRTPAPRARVAPRPAVRREVRPIAPVRPLTRSRDSRFMGLVIVVAVLSALSLLLLNTMRAEQSFTLSTLRSDVASLDDREQALRSELSAMSAPEALAMKADAYGMAPASRIDYVSRDTKKKIGVAGSAAAGSRLSVNTLPNTPSSRAAAQVLTSGEIGLHITDPVARAKAAADKKAAEAKAEADKKAAEAKAQSDKKTEADKKAAASSSTGDEATAEK